MSSVAASSDSDEGTRLTWGGKQTLDKHVAPAFGLQAFHCPHCGVYANQNWPPLFLPHPLGKVPLPQAEVAVTQCAHCDEFGVWHKEALVSPAAGVGPLPCSDMPHDVKTHYLEAREIVARSPRGAAALLRLCVQVLMPHLGQPGKNLNDDIAALVEGGLPKQVQKSLDAVRVVGNSSVHPGQIDVNDTPETAQASSAS